MTLDFFDRGSLRARVWPEISTGGKILAYGEHGYRDRLCELINKAVQEVALDGDDTVRIVLGGACLRFPLGSYGGMQDRAVLLRRPAGA